MHHSLNEVRIRGTAARVMARAFDLPRWPSFLPHYRWVTVLEEAGERKTVEMACWRGCIPLRWRSHLWVMPEEGRMRFLHIAGPARGMDVEWTVRQEGDEVYVAIRHEMALQVPLVRTAAGRWIVAEVFVKAVAGRTLACLKEAVEGRGDGGTERRRDGETERRGDGETAGRSGGVGEWGSEGVRGVGCWVLGVWAFGGGGYEATAGVRDGVGVDHAHRHGGG